MTIEQIQILKIIADTVVDAVKASGPNGAPGGHIYAALMVHGCTFNQYEQIMSGLVAAKKLRQSGNLYFAK